MHKETVEMTIRSSMFKAILIFENNNIICIEIVETNKAKIK